VDLLSGFKKLIWLLIAISIFSFMLTGCSQIKKENTAIAGKYYSENNNDFIEFKTDGKLELKQEDQSYTGEYENKNNQITIKIEGGMEATGTIEGNIFTDNEGLNWIKK
jgi:hypothetical protein